MERELPPGVIKRSRENKDERTPSGTFDKPDLKQGERRERPSIVRLDQFGEVPGLEEYAHNEVTAVDDRTDSYNDREVAAMDRLIAHLEAFKGYDATDPERPVARDLLIDVADGLVKRGLITEEQRDVVRFYTAVGTELSSKQHIDGILQVTDPQSGKKKRLLLNVTHRPEDENGGKQPIGEAPEVDSKEYLPFIAKTASHLTERLETMMNIDRQRAA